MSVVDPLTVSEGHPDDVAVVSLRETVTFRELVARVEARRRTLEARGARAGELAPRLVRASLESTVELLALWRLGAVPVPLHDGLTEVEADDARARLAGATVPPATQVVLWTSGTSGRSRGVALSWANLEASARAAARRLDLGPSDVWMASLSPAHVGGLALLTRSLLLGGAFVVPGTRDAATLSRWLDGGVGPGTGGDGRVLVPTHVSLVPTQLRRLLDHRGDRGAPEILRCVLVGGAHAPRDLVGRALGGGWPVALTYGATEMSSQIATSPPPRVRASWETGQGAGTVGLPLDGVEVRVARSGELLARGATRALDYVASAGPSLVDDEGWYHTGDLGRIEADGSLRITGRRIDRIVSGGVTVDAVEVEEALREHPTVVDVCVVGVPDEEWGERVAAWIVPVHGELELAELERHARSRLSAAKRPRFWHVDARLPRNANGKVDRAGVREVLSEGRG